LETKKLLSRVFCNKEKRNMKKIVISLAIIGMVAGITLGITGAYWTGAGTSTNTQSFRSGTLDLQLANGWNDPLIWLDEVTGTWSYENQVKYENIVPGEGSAVGGTIFLRNTGSIPASWLKFDFVTTPTPDTLDDVMEVIILRYAGEDLLEYYDDPIEDQNGNGFIDLEDLDLAEIIIDCRFFLREKEEDVSCWLGTHAGEPGGEEEDTKQSLLLVVKLNEEELRDEHQGGTIGLDVIITMGQGPVPGP
jgi:hypothetical protein